MNKKIKILGLSAFIVTGMAPLGATQVFADDANPTQIEEQLDVDENSDIDSIEEEARENQIEEQEIVDQESQEEQEIENTNESEDISSNEDQGAEDGDLVTVINEDMHTQETEIEDNDQDLDENENIDEENQDIDVDDVEKDQNIDNNESDQFELIGKPNNSDIPKTSDAGIGGYVGTMVAAIGGLFALIKKMI